MYNIFWWRDKRYGYNFGDEIVPWLIKKMFNYRYDYPCSLKEKNILFSIGSILWACNAETTVWGSGIISMKEHINRPRKICSVRGLFSRKKIMDCEIECPEIYGDPALLLPQYLNKNINKKYKLGIIPHIIDYKKVYYAYKNLPNTTIINLNSNNIESIVSDILSCENTISSALHGIIVSVAYQIPTRWVKFSDKLYGDNIKFYDFFSSIDNNVFHEFDWKRFISKDTKYNPIDLKNNRNISIEKIIQSTKKYQLKNEIINSIINYCPIPNETKNIKSQS